MDRNNHLLGCGHADIVALRKESVDRNCGCLLCSALDAVGSLSARRAWIEIVKYLGDIDWTKVALRKESVDRNAIIPAL